MELETFITDFAAQLEEPDSYNLKAETVFRDIDEWNSLTAMSVIAMTDEKYKVRLTGNEIRNAVTILDIFNIIEAKLK